MGRAVTRDKVLETLGRSLRALPPALLGICGMVSGSRLVCPDSDFLVCAYMHVTLSTSHISGLGLRDPTTPDRLQVPVTWRGTLCSSDPPFWLGSVAFAILLGCTLRL